MGVYSRLAAQDPGLEYFAKVPTKYKNKEVSPLKFFQVSYMNLPQNKFIANSVYIASDLFKVRLDNRLSLAFSLGFDYGNRKEKKEMYEVNNNTAKEKISYNSFMPLTSVSCNYGFFYPYFIRGGIGLYSTYESAKYIASIPQQKSGQNGIETYQIDYVYKENNNSGIKPYTYFEIYSPFKDKPNGTRRFGATAGIYIWPKAISENKVSYNIGIYWNAN